MYLDYTVDIPNVKGKITFRSKGNAPLVDMGITPHTPTQNRTCPIKAYGFSLYIHTTCKTGLP